MRWTLARSASTICHVESGIISVHSERQAEDWSVVLLSQGIESTIQPNAETGQWQLLVDRENYSRALRTLRVYITENKRRVWVQPVPWSGGLVFDWRSPVWFLVLAALFYLSTYRAPGVRDLGMVDSAQIEGGQWWRFFTATMLHGDMPHLASNCTIGVIFLGLAMAQYGAGVALLASFLSGAAANLVSFVIYRHPYRGLGASGVVMAALGMLAVHSIWLWRTQRPVGPVVLRSVLGGLLLLVLVGFDPASDVVAHVSGFVVGGIFGAVARDRWAENDAANTIAGLVCGALAGLCWWLALR
ncbi:MAG TPA: rhomboid family intramembrane serine protease [Verrucomicrobiae bacterium]|nr:rhomboid family intramembrane serine protease [Verrucomicrobiae bacterium]